MDYIAETNRTAAGVVHPELCDHALILEALENFAAASNDLTAVKKAYWYGKITPDVLALESRLAYETADVNDLVSDDALHGIVGLGTEAAELADLVVEAYHTGEPITRQQLIDEGGDALWYLARIFKAAGVTFEEVMEANIAKLRKRFPDKFDLTAWENRDKAAELQVQGTFQ